MTSTSSHLALVDDRTRALDRWPADTRLGYVVRGADGIRRDVAVGLGGTFEVEGLGSFEIVEEVRVAERRAGLEALRDGRI
jgi:hypothetical protein